MIKLRTTAGKSYRLAPDVRFVEICDKNGGVAAVVFVRDDGSITLYRSGEEEFENYIKAYKAVKAKLIIKHD